MNQIKILSRCLPLKILAEGIFISGNWLNRKQLKGRQIILSYDLKTQEISPQLRMAILLAERKRKYS